MTGLDAVLGNDGFHHLQLYPELLLEHLHLVGPSGLLFCRDLDGGVVRLGHPTLLILHSHQGRVDVLDLSKRPSTIALARHVRLRPPFRSRSTHARWSIGILVAIGPFDVEHLPRRLDVAERYLAETALDDELVVFGLQLGRLDRSLHLLLHPLHVHVATTLLASADHAAMPGSSLEEIRLCEGV